jgi:hypothetical protein
VSSITGMSQPLSKHFERKRNTAIENCTMEATTHGCLQEYNRFIRSCLLEKKKGRKCVENRCIFSFRLHAIDVGLYRIQIVYTALRRVTLVAWDHRNIRLLHSLKSLNIVSYSDEKEDCNKLLDGSDYLLVNYLPIILF